MSELDVIGARIRTLREARGLTQAELGQGVNASRELVNMWERGARDLKTGTIIDLARFFNVSCDYILTGVEAQHLGIHETLGLEESIIQLLEEENKIRKNPPVKIPHESYTVNILNGLLAPNETMMISTLELIYEYLYFDFAHPYHATHDNGSPQPFEEKLFFKIEDVLPGRWRTIPFDGTVFEEAYLEMIKNDLRFLRKMRYPDAQEDNP